MNKYFHSANLKKDIFTNHVLPRYRATYPAVLLSLCTKYSLGIVTQIDKKLGTQNYGILLSLIHKGGLLLQSKHVYWKCYPLLDREDSYLCVVYFIHSCSQFDCLKYPAQPGKPRHPEYV